MIELPAGWSTLTLGEIATLQRGSDLPTSQREAGPYPVIGSNGVLGTHSRFVAAGPGVTVGRSGSVGQVVWIEKDYWPLNTALWVKDFHGNDPNFVYFLLRHLNLGRYAEGVSVPTLNRNIVHPVEVNLPSLSEQKAIAVTLRAVQEARDARRRELAAERERKAALMEDLFTGGVRGEARQETEIGPLPQSWRIASLAEVVRHTIKDGTHKTPRYVESGVPFVTAKDVVDNRLTFSKCAFVTQDDHLLLNKSTNPEEGDVLLTKVGSVGNVAVVEKVQPFSIFVQLALLKPQKGVVLSHFLYFALQTATVQREIYNNSSQSTMRFIGTQKIATVRVPLPSLDEQQDIATILTACDGKIAALEAEAALHDELFRALLDELLSGRVSTRPLIEDKKEN